MQRKTKKFILFLVLGCLLTGLFVGYLECVTQYFNICGLIVPDVLARGGGHEIRLS